MAPFRAPFFIPPLAAKIIQPPYGQAPSALGFKRFREGGGGFAAIFKVSVTGLAFCVIWYDRHSADWLAALASPYPASPDFPRSSVGQSKGRPFYGQAKGQLRPTCTSYAGCAHQPSGILESTAQVPVPIPTAPRGACTLNPQRGLSIKSKSTASAVLLPIFIPYDVQWLLSPVPRRGDGGGWGGS